MTVAGPVPSAPDLLHHAAHPGAGDQRVLLLHSLALDSGVWRSALPALRHEASVLTCDLPGHGRSPGRGPITIEAMADAVAEVVRAEAPEGVVVWGLSLGGCVAQALAVRFPELVHGLGLVDTTAWYGPTAAADWSARAARAREDGLASLADFQLARWFSGSYRERRAQETRRLLGIFRRNDLDSYAHTCAAMGAMDLRALLSRVRMPAAVVVGEFDPATPIEHAEDLARRIPGSTLTIFEGCGHLSPLEQPGRFVGEVKRLLRRSARTQGEGDATGA